MKATLTILAILAAIAGASVISYEIAYQRAVQKAQAAAFYDAYRDVTVPREYQSPFPDAIRVLLECVGYSRFMYLPYRVTKPRIFARLTKAGFRCEFGEFISVDVPPMISTGKKTGELRVSHRPTPLISPKSPIIFTIHMAQLFKRDGSPARRAWLI